MTAWEPITVSARWNMDGHVVVRQFRRKGGAATLMVESTGRQWEEEDGLHVLCMVSGLGVFELRFQLQPAGWLLRQPRHAQAA